MKQDPSIGSGCWYLGQIYINPDDKRIIVRKRSRLGWTFNFGRPSSFAVLLLTIAYALAPTYLLLHFEVESPWAHIAANMIMIFGLIAFCMRMERVKERPKNQ
ncbi:DUF5808 domain-containing protein [Pontiellaceae bacterium B12227]|nr:DUF5808 domain-containing protein [Pontiellaceae bacterium B12227]